MELYELFDQTVSELEPMPDQVAAAQRIWRRRQRATLSAVFATGAAFAIGAGTLIASAPWAGHSGLEPTAGTDMNMASYSKLVDSALSRLWPVRGRSIGHVNVEFSSVFPISVISVALGPGGTFAPYLNLSITQQTSAAARHAQTCPKLAAGAYFCTTTTLADGTVVQVTNINSPIAPVVGVPSQYPVQLAPSALGQYSGPASKVDVVPFGVGQVGASAGSTNSGPPVFTVMDQEVSVWEGDYVETLFVPNAPSPTLTDAQLLTLGTSSDFQMLLTVAVESNLVPGTEAATPTAWPTLMSTPPIPSTTATAPASFVPPPAPPTNGWDTNTAAPPTATVTAMPTVPWTDAPTTTTTPAAPQN